MPFSWETKAPVVFNKLVEFRTDTTSKERYISAAANAAKIYWESKLVLAPNENARDIGGGSAHHPR